MKQPQRNTLRRGRRGLAKAAGLFSSLALWALAASATPACNSLGDGGDKTIPNSGKGDPMTTKQNTASTTGGADDLEKKGECRTKLSPSAYMVTQLGGTEPPHSGKYVHHKGQGTYVCVCCGQPLFESTTKFDSGSGWPSFYEAAEKGSVTLHRDTSHGMARTEVRCGRCNAHLGHVFDDGPKPTGKRYCINSVALDFEHTVAPESR